MIMTQTFSIVAPTWAKQEVMLQLTRTSDGGFDELISNKNVEDMIIHLLWCPSTDK